HPRIVEVALRDQHQVPTQPRAERLDLESELLEKMNRRVIHDRMHGIDPQAVEVILGQPHERVVTEISAHLLAPIAVEVDGIPPRGAIAACEVRTETLQMIPDRPEMVVYDVEQHGEPACMTGIDQTL